MSKTYTGFTAETPKSLLLDSGAFFFDYDMATDTFASAVTAGKLIGATRGGGSFSAVPEVRKIEADGIRGAIKGLSFIDSWEVKMSANVLEITQNVIEKALLSSNKFGEIAHDKITANSSIDIGDYIDNVTFVGKQSGYSDPLIIQVYNAINTSGLTLSTSDKGESVIELEFEGHFDASDLDTPPFAIYYPSFM